MELYQLTAEQLSAMLAKKECSSEELTRSVLNRIEQKDGEIGAYLTVCGEEALKKAAEVDAKRAAGENLHPLAGIPVGIKDNICTRGIRTTCASRMLENFVPPYDAFVMEKLHQADAVILGKLNMDEFAMGSSTENSYFQKTKNPFDLDRVPGGSSGGSAAAVSSGEAVLTLGSDTGGSIRQPASFCGVVGLKPTYSAVSRYGLVAFASSLDQIGPMGRSVKDTAMMFQAICGRDPHDATSAVHDYPDYTANWNTDVKGLRIGLPKEYFGDGISAEVRESVMKMAEELKNRGAELVEGSLPSTDYALAAYYIIACAEASSNLARYDGVRYGYRAKEFANLTEMYEKSRSEGFGAEVKRRIMLGTYVLSSGYYDAYYKKAKFTQIRIQEEFAKAFDSCDLLLTPTVPETSFRIGENIDDQIKMYMNDILTVTVNIAGLPGISVPCGFDGKGLPIGAQLIGPKFSEGTLFRCAAGWEEICGGFDLSRTLA
ncbi:MAG TPA: Asp-tRNA(Asn)/Glu-tRNA(Gln) amidotransferase subunit GatA [Candidatus Merdivicinus excrementipullorum]|uniref:Glutamyl-tRNA(Gln) amidotransferase subunit A n=1 Tax=Candidatus Merdivicinus excrementipullorum TaxID=2840867 RepID=A0A9D1JZF8_9FIRM|nr:Asp-tRNA(Asn)/Glu-tRNA(Gln) amidotransferase subunit GatA [Candidatus Merdivicinus excrementipullorum]